MVIQLDKKSDSRLTRLAREAGRTKIAYARQAILEHLDDLEDAKLAGERLANPARIYSSREVNSECALLSEAALAEDWNRPEENQAWAHLQQER